MADLRSTSGPGTAILHIGPHKTGTTAIQRTLVENPKQLHAHGFAYPEIGYNQYGHHKIAALLEKSDSTQLFEIAAALAKYQDQTVILSSENFSSLSLPGMDRLANLLVRFRDIRIVVYVRNFLELPYTWWQEQVKHRRADDFDGFLINCLCRPNTVRVFNAAAIIEKFNAVFQNKVSVFLYDQVMSNYEDTARHFMREILGIREYSPLRGAKTVNRSLDPAAAEIVRCLNRSGLHGIRVFMSHPEGRMLHAAVKQRADAYLKALTLSYEDPVLRQTELKLRKILDDLNIPCDGTPHHQVFGKREQKIEYLDPTIWLFEPEIAFQMRGFAAAAIEEAKTHRDKNGAASARQTGERTSRGVKGTYSTLYREPEHEGVSERRIRR